MTDRWRRLTPNIKRNLQCLLSIKYIAKQWKKTHDTKDKESTIVTLHQEAQRVGNFCTDVWNESEIEI